MDGNFCAAAGKELDVAYAAAASAPERTKLRRDKMLFMSGNKLRFLRIVTSGLDVWSPALFVLTPPHLHGLWIALDSSVLRVEL